MSQKIKVMVVKFNQLEYAGGCLKEICCPFQVVGTYWRSPELSTGGEVIGHYYTPASEAKPGTDSVKIVKIHSCGDNVEVAINDADTDQVLKDACDLCCGDAPVDFSSVTVPEPIQEVRPCEDENGDRKIAVSYPSVNANLNLAGTFDGVDGTPAPSNPTGTAAQIKTWANANWSAYGSWDVDATNKMVVLTLDPSVTSAGFTITV